MQRSERRYGYFAGERFGHRRGTEIVDEIALDPRTFINRTDREIVSTLVHEMVQAIPLRQARTPRLPQQAMGGGDGSDRPYAVALRQARRQTHRPADDPLHPRRWIVRYTWQPLAEAGFTLDYQDRYALRPPDPKKVKVRYACPVCSIHVWGKPDLRLRCEVCGERDAAARAWEHESARSRTNPERGTASAAACR
jgi:hypothetical protein